MLGPSVPEVNPMFCRKCVRGGGTVRPMGRTHFHSNGGGAPQHNTARHVHKAGFAIPTSRAMAAWFILVLHKLPYLSNQVTIKPDATSPVPFRATVWDKITHTLIFTPRLSTLLSPRRPSSVGLPPPYEEMSLRIKWALAVVATRARHSTARIGNFIGRMCVWLNVGRALLFSPSLLFFVCVLF